MWPAFQAPSLDRCLTPPSGRNCPCGVPLCVTAHDPPNPGCKQTPVYLIHRLLHGENKRSKSNERKTPRSVEHFILAGWRLSLLLLLLLLLCAASSSSEVDFKFFKISALSLAGSNRREGTARA